MNAMNRVPIGGARKLLWSIAFVLIGIQLARLIAVMPDWLAGVAPSRPGKYERRASNALASVPILLTTIVNTWPGVPTRRRFAVVVVLMVTAGIGLFWLSQIP